MFHFEIGVHERGHGAAIRLPTNDFNRACRQSTRRKRPVHRPERPRPKIRQLRKRQPERSSKSGRRQQLPNQKLNHKSSRTPRRCSKSPKTRSPRSERVSASSGASTRRTPSAKSTPPCRTGPRTPNLSHIPTLHLPNHTTDTPDRGYTCNMRVYTPISEVTSNVWVTPYWLVEHNQQEQQRFN